MNSNLSGVNPTPSKEGRSVKIRQGDRINAYLRSRWMSSMELLQLGVSTCWWKRSKECLQPGERLEKTDGPHGGFLYRVVKE